MNARITAPLHHELIPKVADIEVATSLQLPSFFIVGLPAPEVAEARERVRSAIQSSGFEFPRRRIVLNLSPASVRKNGTGLDLGMALAILLSDSDVRIQCMAWGELGLDGSVKATGQTARAIYACWKAGMPKILLPAADIEAARLRMDIMSASTEFTSSPPLLVPVRDLREAMEQVHSAASAPGENPGPSPCSRPAQVDSPPPALLVPSPTLRRILGAVCAGDHHVLLMGPRGTGKTQAIEWLAATLPPESDINRVHRMLMHELSDAFTGLPKGLSARPVRRVGTQVRPAALTGSSGIHGIRPGELSLAHGGLLVADEIPEWPRDARECLREPLERGLITLTRARGSAELPARFILGATGNLCPCGGWPTELSGALTESQSSHAPPPCTCAHSAQRSYLARMSGPLLDRIDVIVRLNRLPKIRPDQNAPESILCETRERITEASERLIQSYGTRPAQLPATRLEEWLQRRPPWREALDRFGQASLRGRHKILRVAMSLAAWDGRVEPGKEHFMEASLYR